MFQNARFWCYSPYRGGLRLWDGRQLQALEKASPLVASLATPAATTWLIHPREISDRLRAEMDLEWPANSSGSRE